MKFDRAIVFVHSHKFALTKLFWDVPIDELPNSDETHNIRDLVMNSPSNSLTRELRVLHFTHQFHNDKAPYKYRVFARVQTGTENVYLKGDLIKLNYCFYAHYKDLEKKVTDGSLKLGDISKTQAAYELTVDEFPSMIVRLYPYQTLKEKDILPQKKRNPRMADDETVLSGGEGKFN